MCYCLSWLWKTKAHSYADQLAARPLAIDAGQFASDHLWRKQAASAPVAFQADDLAGAAFEFLNFGLEFGVTIMGAVNHHRSCCTRRTCQVIVDEFLQRHSPDTSR